MSVRNRAEWKSHIEQIVRSKRYTWIGEGLGGESLAEALTDMLADITPTRECPSVVSQSDGAF